MKTLLTALLSIAISVAAQFSLKAGMSGSATKEILGGRRPIPSLLSILLDKYVLLGFVLYGLGAIVWLGVLSKWEVSKAYPLVGLGFVLTAVVGYVAGEQVTGLRVLGVAMICAGVYVVART